MAIRCQREKWAEKKLAIAARVAERLKLIPTIKMVAVTGALAMKNSDQDDDIDLLIVTARGRLWLTRLLTVLIVELVAQRRRPGTVKVRDKICLNMFLDESYLSIPPKERDLYSAHEICQLQPLWNKDNLYLRFLRENSWAKNFLPNGMEIKKLGKGEIEGKKVSVFNYLISQLLNYCELLARFLQLKYMSSRRTTEVIEPGRLRFHPHDCREKILVEYKKRLENLSS